MNIMRPQRSRHRIIEVAAAVYFAVYLIFVSLHTGVTLVSKWIGRGRRRQGHSPQSHTRPKARGKKSSRPASRSEPLVASSPKANASRVNSPTAERLLPKIKSPVSLAVNTFSGVPRRQNAAATSSIVTIGQRASSAEASALVKHEQDNNGFAPSIENTAEPTGIIIKPSRLGADSVARQAIISKIYARSPRSWWQRLWRPVAALVVVVTLIASARAAAAYIGADTTLVVRIGSQQPVIIDPRASFPRNPYVFGVNVFPEEATQALDGAYGFMPYDAKTLAGLKGAGVTMLRFPGGAWGEEHTASFTQIGAFLTLAQKTHAMPLIQIRLMGGSPTQAAALVSYCNHASDLNRKSTPNIPFLPVRFWVIGNEPNLVGPNYTVNDYVNDFIANATAMKAVDPTIQIYGPELSELNGLNAPRDSTGTPWLTGFLKGIAAYEKTHHTRILDGVSFHSYVFGSGASSLSLLLSSANAWRYTLSQIRPVLQEIMGEIMGWDIPIGITEINTNVQGDIDLLSAALWWADNLGTLQEEQVNIVDFFAARGLPEQDMLLTQSGDPTPLSFVMQLYAHMASNVVQVGGTSGPVSVYAATSPSHDTITLMFINKSPSIAAATIDPGQNFSNWHSERVMTPPYAIVCVVLHRDGSGQSFTYGPTPSMLAHGDEGRITVQSLS